MKKLLFIILLLLAGCFLFLPQVVVKGAEMGLTTCATAILPSLFPFFVLTDLLIRLGYAAKLSQLAAPLTEKLFHLPGSASSAVLLGCIGGYPMGARTAAQLYAEGQLSKHDAEQALYFCNNAGPAFVFGVMGIGIFHSTRIGAVLYLIHIFSALLVGILLRQKTIHHEKLEKEPAAQTFSNAIVTSIRQAGMTTIQICIFVVFFSILIQCFIYLMPENDMTLFLPGILELASGAGQIEATSWPVQIKFISAAFLLGLGGLCVMMQTQSILQEAGLSCKPVYFGKLLQAVISGLLAWMTTPLLPLASPCMTEVPSPTLWLLQQSAIFLLTALLIGLFLKKSSGKVRIHRI